MRFINKKIVTAFALLALVGCSSTPDAPTTLTEETSFVKTEVDKVDSQELRKQALLSSPNAYLLTAEVLPDSLTESFKQALVLKNNDQLGLAKQHLLSLQNQYPQFSGIKLQLGDIALAQQDQSTAMLHYHAAVDANQYNYYAHNRLGALQRKLGKFTAAANSYQAAISAWPGFSAAYLNLAILQDLYLNKKVSALKSYQTYQLLNPQGERRVKVWIRDVSYQIAKANKG